MFGEVVAAGSRKRGWRGVGVGVGVGSVMGRHARRRVRDIALHLPRSI